MRKEKGLNIATISRIEKSDEGWKVPSQSSSGYYIVKSDGFEATCTCPDYETRKENCKHIWAVKQYIAAEPLGSVIIKTPRKTYSQAWKSYNIAKQKEKEVFMELLADLTGLIQQPAYTFGRPTNLLSDTIYSMIFKVYSTYAGRRFATDIQIAKEKGFVEKRIPYNSMFDYFNKEELTPLLTQLVTITSLPLRTVEKDFAVDSSGFGTSVFQRWFSFKHGKEISSRRWVKCHFMTGVKTNIITSAKITAEYDNDCPQLQELVNKTAENFDMEEVSADKAYLSRYNLELITEKGAMPYIPFKISNKATGNGKTWRKMFYYFMANREEFLDHFHKRSNIESSVQMIKSKCGSFVRSKNWTAQVNEVLCKIITHNICCVVQEMHELQIVPNFCPNGQQLKH